MKLNKKLILTFSAFLGIAISGTVVETNKTVVYAGENHLGCDANSSYVFAQRYADSQAWKDYIKSLGIPESIQTKKGRTAWIQKDKSIEECMPIYGTPSLAADNLGGRQTQEVLYAGGQSFYKYQGLTIKGTPFLDSRYVEAGTSYDYMKTGNFVYHPWENSALIKSIEQSSVKPFPIPPTKWGKTSYKDPATGKQPTNVQILERSVDRRYTQFCDQPGGDNCVRGLRGYLDVANNNTRLTWTGNQLGNYVSFEVVPGQFDPGVWNIYRHGTDGIYYYNPSYTKPYTMFTTKDQTPDLKITINKITPSTVMENTYIAVAYSVCNDGVSTVYKPTIKYGDATSANSTVKVLENIQILPHKCVSGEIWDVVRSVSANTTATYRMEVNPDKNNPSGEGNWSNNVSTKPFTIVNRVVSVSIEITGVSPTIPYSNQLTTINYRIINRSNINFYNLTYRVGFEGKSEARSVSIASADWETGAPSIYYGSIVQPAKAVPAYTDTVKVIAQITSGAEEDPDRSDNSDVRVVTIQNPDAYVLVKGVNDGDNNLSKINIHVYNKMFKTITNNCASSAAGCLSGTPNKTFTYQIYDTKMTDTLSDDVLIKNYTTSTYNLAHDGKTSFTIPKSVITDWVDANYPNSYQAVQFRVVATIPNYSVEVDWDGNPQYDNNTDTKYFTYIPPRDIAFNACTQIKHNNASYFTFTTSNKVSINKICAGHYPTYPSTKVENGMQAYHYVLYRFLAQPIPRYEITTIQTDVTNTNYFTQITKLQDQYESKTVRGDSDSMIFPKNTINGFNMERGRYVPTGGTFTFGIYEKKKDGSQGKQIAIGTVTHQIPTSCYDKEYLDISNQMGCNDVVFFLPNSDSGDAKYKKPANYSSDDVTYPITSTRVPYLNPGNYTFSFEGVETFRYYYQTNLSKDRYNWSNPKFK